MKVTTSVFGYKLRVYDKDGLLADTRALEGIARLVQQTPEVEGISPLSPANPYGDFVESVAQYPDDFIGVTASRNDVVVGTLFGYPAFFTQERFMLENPVPKGKYTYLFRWNCGEGNLPAIMALTGTMREHTPDTHYYFFYVLSGADIYRRGFYPAIGATEVRSGLPEIGEQGSYFYITRDNLIRRRGGD